jgi:hypothetical protein
MAMVYIEKITTISDLVRWKAEIDSCITQMEYFQSCITSAMGMDKSKVITPADIQFRYDSKLKELTDTLRSK